MTWREEIQRACAGVGRAEAERERVLRAAHDAGLSTREIAKVAGATHSTVWRWMGGTAQTIADVSLDSEADLDGSLREIIDKYVTNPDESPLRAANAKARETPSRGRSEMSR